MDGRRRQFVPVSVDIARSRTGRRLLDRFGPNGLLVWMLVLAAAKKSFTQGEFEYTSEADGWERLGLEGHRMGFTLQEFFDYTGRMHNTKKIREKTVQIRAWNEWNSSIRLEQKAAQSRRKRAQNKDEIRPTELEIEREREAIPPSQDEGEALSLDQNAVAARQLVEQLAGKLRSP